MANHPGSPARWSVRGAFALAQGSIALTVYVAVEGGPVGAVTVLAVLTTGLMLLTLGGGIYLDVVRPHLIRHRRR